MSDEREDLNLQERIDELEKTVETLMDWIAVLGKQDATVMQLTHFLLASVTGKPTPPSADHAWFMSESQQIVDNAITMNDYQIKREKEKQKEREEE